MTTVSLPNLYRRDPEVRRIAREIAKIKRDVRSLSRASQAAYRSSDGTGNDEDLGDFDDDGNPLDPQGHTPGWVPPTPTAPDINPYRDAIEIIWDGTFEDAEWDQSIDTVLIHILPEVISEPEEATVVGSFGEEGGVFPYNVTLDEPIRYVVLQAVSIHGVVGGWSVPLQVVPLLGVDPADLAALQEDLAELNDVVLPDLNSQLTGIQGLFPVTSTNIADDAITTPKLIANAVIGDKILANSVFGDRIIANTIQGNRIVVNSLNGDRIIANTIQGDRIIANTLTGDRIIANTINGDRIIAGTITASHLTATAIDGKTITGATVRTNSGSNRVQLRDDGTGGVLESYTGDVAETKCGAINPSIAGTLPSRVPVIDFYSPSLSGYTRGHFSLRGRSADGTVAARTVFDTNVDVNGTMNATWIEASGTIDASDVITGYRLVTGIGTTGAAANTYMDSAGMLLKSTSSLRYKNPVRKADLTAAVDALLDLDAEVYTSKDDPDGRERVGWYAERLHESEALRPWVDYDAEDRPDGIGYGGMVVPLLALAQRQQAQIAGLQQQRAEDRARIEALEAA